MGVKWFLSPFFYGSKKYFLFFLVIFKNNITFVMKNKKIMETIQLKSLSVDFLIEELTEYGLLVCSPEKKPLLAKIIQESKTRENANIMDSHENAYIENGYPYIAKDSAKSYLNENFGD
jgi:hypothetical protein